MNGEVIIRTIDSQSVNRNKNVKSLKIEKIQKDSGLKVKEACLPAVSSGRFLRTYFLADNLDFLARVSYTHVCWGGFVCSKPYWK